MSQNFREKCTRGVATPVADTVIGGYQVVRTAVAPSSTAADYDGAPISRSADIVLGAG